ncbi:MAG: type II secretion system protein [Candidatus Eremiobacteraeota bacterium]|nr:type II secretion system protein [Candidatus Eremiobacteraeota bacterium]
MKGRRGITLHEILVVGVLMALIATCLYWALLPGIRAWRRSDTRADIQKTALVAMKKIETELRASDRSSLVILKQNYQEKTTGRTLACDAITFLSPFGRTGGLQYDTLSGSILWQKHGVFYLQGETGTLHIQEDFFAPSDAPSPYQAGSFTPRPSADRVVARNVKSLSFSARQDGESGDTALANPVTYELLIGIEHQDATFISAVSAMHNGDQE